METPQEQRKEKLARYIVLGVVASILILAGVVASNPLRRSNETIKRRLQKSTPIGSNFEDVTSAAKNHGWYSPGLYAGSRGLATNNITGDLGSYQGFPFKITVIAIWEFDSVNRLTNIQIWREQDAL